jgi:hypothetical protein
VDREDLIIAKYGVTPKVEDRIDIRKLLIEEIENEKNVDNHECLRVLCFLLFSIGIVEDCEVIWKAKTLNMDTRCMIDGVFLCGAGYKETLSYIEDKTRLEEMKGYIVRNINEGFDKKEVINEFKEYYKVQ